MFLPRKDLGLPVGPASVPVCERETLGGCPGEQSSSDRRAVGAHPEGSRRAAAAAWCAGAGASEALCPLGREQEEPSGEAGSPPGRVWLCAQGVAADLETAARLEGSGEPLWEGPSWRSRCLEQTRQWASTVHVLRGGAPPGSAGSSPALGSVHQCPMRRVPRQAVLSLPEAPAPWRWAGRVSEAPTGS